jgi:monoamine oxidase
MFFMFSNEIIPTWWTQYPEPYLTLTGWVAGPKALSVSTKSDAEILDLALSSLSNIFKVEKSQLENELITSKIVNWATDPYARGAYSYTTPESGAAIEELLKPIDDKLFFAGEGVYQGEMGGTVEAALASGKEVASKILTYRG